MKFGRQFIPSHLVVAAIGVLTSLSPVQAQVPQMINHQGFVKVNGANFNGTGYFRFALVDGAGTVSYWSNDGSSTSGSQPIAAVALPVVNGLYSVLLGDTSIANMTLSIPSSIFANADVRLRVWFDDDVSGSQQLAPDQRIVSTGYTLMAADVANGAVTTAKIAVGAVSASQLADGAITASKLAPASVTGPAIAPAAVGNSALAADSVTGAKILDGTISDADLSSVANINASKIIGGDLQALRLKVGSDHTLTGVYATIAGGQGNNAGGLYATIAGGQGNNAGGRFATVGGGFLNTVSAIFATVGGGTGNIASGEDATVGGGFSNAARGLDATVGGGKNNTASGQDATVGGGELNTASFTLATVGGGYNNKASGHSATVPGGYGNIAGGTISFAAGYLAQALHQGAFVWADTTPGAVNSTAANQFTVRATGGARFISGFNPQGSLIGVSLAPKGSQWTSLSDRNAKENFGTVDAREVLAKLAVMPIETWNYKAQDASIRHMGPMAQDFYAAFGLGEDKLGIGTMDADGVAFAALKGLYELVKEKEGVIEQLKQQAALQEEELKIQKDELAVLMRHNAALVTDLDDLKSQVQQVNAMFKSLRNSAPQAAKLSASEKFLQP